MKNWKGFGRKWSQPSLRCYPRISPEGLRKTTKHKYFLSFLTRQTDLKMNVYGHTRRTVTF
jgi:hypothetical protein